MKILITGHKGLVGRHFVKALEDEHMLTKIDIKEGHDAGHFFRHDNTKYDLVIHAAATVGGRKTIDLEPHKLFNNFSLDSELFQWAIKTKPGRVVYFSSSAAYPMNLQYKDSGIRLSEEDINLENVYNPDPSIYGWSKLTGEQFAHYARLNDVPVYVFRPFSGYSELQDLDYPFPSFITRALRRDDPFEIWGTGEQVRDWIHMDDIVSIVLKTIALSDPITMNLCTGKATSFNEFAGVVTTAAGYCPSYNKIVDAPVGVWYRVGDPTLMSNIALPKISLEEGIQRALRAMI